MDCIHILPCQVFETLLFSIAGIATGIATTVPPLVVGNLSVTGGDVWHLLGLPQRNADQFDLAPSRGCFFQHQSPFKSWFESLATRSGCGPLCPEEVPLSMLQSLDLGHEPRLCRILLSRKTGRVQSDRRSVHYRGVQNSPSSYSTAQDSVLIRRIFLAGGSGTKVGGQSMNLQALDDLLPKFDRWLTPR